MRISLILTLACPLALSGCYSGHWDAAEIMVTTMPPGANCTLTRHGEKIGDVASTPGIAMVSRSGDDVSITCRRAGFAEATAVSHATGSALGMATITEGRSGYAYQSPVNIPMQPAP
ncbi:MAG TPA: hypothetical protein VND87_05130 [Stellaceae bacterium]|nr:hypothetical protein [Stellaceae bacterium]